MKVAVVFQRNDWLYVHALSKTVDGIWIASRPFIRIEWGSLSDDKGQAVIDALSASEESVPRPTNWKEVQKPLLELADVKSWSSFSKTSRCVVLEKEEGLLKIIPNKNLGIKEGYEPILEQVIELSPNASTQGIGMGLEEGIKRCQ